MVKNRYLISFENVTKNYGSNEVLKRLNFKVEIGEKVGLIGPNGAGKTTALRIAVGFLKEDAGRVAYGLQLGGGSGSNIGYLPEVPALYSSLTTLQYLRLFSQIKAKGKNSRSDDELAEIIDYFDLGSILSKPISSLSKGFCQRIGLGQAFLGKPHLIVLDEPTNGLDPFQLLDFRKSVLHLSKNKGMIISTHILHEVEEICDRVIFLHEGKAVNIELPIEGMCVEIDCKPEFKKEIAREKLGKIIGEEQKYKGQLTLRLYTKKDLSFLRTYCSDKTNRFQFKPAVLQDRLLAETLENA